MKSKYKTKTEATRNQYSHTRYVFVTALSISRHFSSGPRQEFIEENSSFRLASFAFGGCVARIECYRSSCGDSRRSHFIFFAFKIRIYSRITVATMCQNSNLTWQHDAFLRRVDDQRRETLNPSLFIIATITTCEWMNGGQRSMHWVCIVICRRRMTLWLGTDNLHSWQIYATRTAREKAFGNYRTCYSMSEVAKSLLGFPRSEKSSLGFFATILPKAMSNRSIRMLVKIVIDLAVIGAVDDKRNRDAAIKRKTARTIEWTMNFKRQPRFQSENSIEWNTFTCTTRSTYLLAVHPLLVP